jgi:glycosyltransferase involved in cell wall biosynthesis
MINGNSTNHPLVSVVIPTCNRSGLLQRAIASVLRQTYEHLEVIVVDDASTDDTRKVVESFHDHRIRYVRHTTNRGGSAARNTGVDAATGQYIAFLDDDDGWVPEKTQKQLEVLRHFDAVLCTCSVNGRSCAKRRPREVVAPRDLRRSPYAVGGTGVLMAKAGTIKDLRFDEQLPICQDWDLFIRIAQRCDIAYLNEPLLIYNEGSHERITNKRARMTPAELEPYMKMLEKHRLFLGSGWYNRHIAGMLLYGFFRHRPNKVRHLLYTVRRCGMVAVARVFARRALQVATKYA